METGLPPWVARMPLASWRAFAPGVAEVMEKPPVVPVNSMLSKVPPVSLVVAVRVAAAVPKRRMEPGAGTASASQLVAVLQRRSVPPSQSAVWAWAPLLRRMAVRALRPVKDWGWRSMG